ncbi:MAG TPA: hypothetical protein VIO61_02355 [Anaerolineaceae bacterium]
MEHVKTASKPWTMALVVSLVLMLVGVLCLFASPQGVAASGESAPPSQKPDNSACLACHGRPDQRMKIGNTEFSITIDQKVYESSIHANVNCQVCHTNLSGYPHPKNTAADRLAYVNQYKDTCKQCHPGQTKDQEDSIHNKMRLSGNPNAPTCASCHNPHTQAPVKKNADGTPASSEHILIAQTCARCHNGIYEQYKNSVHGAGVIENKNPDVPACTECHGVHKIHDPTTAQFRLSSTQMCGKCHTDPAIKKKYGLTLDVMSTYVADFHGTTVTLFEKQTPDAQTNKPVCYDCHGIHDIAKTDDPQKGLKIKQNILVSCQRCHPDATLDFSDSWLSHYTPDSKKFPLVFYVQWFYNILIPLVLGGMAVFVLSDIYARIRHKAKRTTDTGRAS